MHCRPPLRARGWDGQRSSKRARKTDGSEAAGRGPGAGGGGTRPGTPAPAALPGLWGAPWQVVTHLGVCSPSSGGHVNTALTEGAQGGRPDRTLLQRPGAEAPGGETEALPGVERCAPGVLPPCATWANTTRVATANFLGAAGLVDRGDPPSGGGAPEAAPACGEVRRGPQAQGDRAGERGAEAVRCHPRETDPWGGIRLFQASTGRGPWNERPGCPVAEAKHSPITRVDSNKQPPSHTPGPRRQSRRDSQMGRRPTARQLSSRHPGSPGLRTPCLLPPVSPGKIALILRTAVQGREDQTERRISSGLGEDAHAEEVLSVSITT